MCLSLRLRCLLLLNGGRQGDCVRVEFWLREALLQRLQPVILWRCVTGLGHEQPVASNESGPFDVRAGRPRAAALGLLPR